MTQFILRVSSLLVILFLMLLKGSAISMTPSQKQIMSTDLFRWLAPTNAFDQPFSIEATKRGEELQLMISRTSSSGGPSTVLASVMTRRSSNALLQAEDTHILRGVKDGKNPLRARLASGIVEYILDKYPTKSKFEVELTVQSRQRYRAEVIFVPYTPDDSLFLDLRIKGSKLIISQESPGNA